MHNLIIILNKLSMTACQVATYMLGLTSAIVTVSSVVTADDWSYSWVVSEQDIYLAAVPIRKGDIFNENKGLYVQHLSRG